jgi:hypothetical protein
MIVVKYHSLDWAFLVEVSGYVTFFVEDGYAFMVRK